MKALNIAKMIIAVSTVFMACSSHALLISPTGTSAGNPPQPTYDVTINSGDAGKTFTMNYAGSGTSAPYVASSLYTINSLSPTELVLTLFLSNLTSISNPSSITGFGFSVTPDATSVTLLNDPLIFDQVMLQTGQQNFPGGFKNIDICGASQKNCAGGNVKTGLQSGASDTIMLGIFGSFGEFPLTQVTLDSFPIKFQTPVGSLNWLERPAVAAAVREPYQNQGVLPSLAWAFSAWHLFGAVLGVSTGKSGLG